MTERTVFQSITRKRVVSVTPQATVRDAARVMTGANFTSVLVVEPPDRLLGILTERDLVTRVLAKGLNPDTATVREVMTANPICVPPETKVSDAVVLMLERGFRHLPLMSGDKVLGVFSALDAVPREIGAAFGQVEFNEQVNDALG